MEDSSKTNNTSDYNERWLPVVVQAFGAIEIKIAIGIEKKAEGSTLSDYSDIISEYSEKDDAFLADSEAVPAEPEGFPEEAEEELHQEEETEEERETSSLFLKVQEMTVAKKIEFSMKCNKEDRTILIRDSNRLVQMSVIRSPKITDTEVVSIANNRSVHEDVLRFISGQREWMKNYEIRSALVFNPKTPLFISMKQVPTLKDRELSKLGKSKSVQRALGIAAVRRLHEVKK